MAKEFFEVDFKGENFTENALAKAEYDNCTFANCVFTNASLSGIIFSECTFENCDLSMANLSGAAFRDVRFEGCKMLGLRFNECNGFLLSFQFEDCVLNFSSFFKLKLKKTGFVNCKLEEVDFAETDLSGSVFKNCDMHRAAFARTNLESADLRSAYNFSIDPENNRLVKAKFSTQNIAGLLDKYKIKIV